MTLLELIEDFRLRTDDTGGDTGTVPSGFTYYWESDDSGCLWKNREITNFFNWAHREIAMRRPYRDSTTSGVCTKTVTAGTASYTIDPLVLSIEDVVLASTGKSLQKTTIRDLRLWATGTESLTGIEAWKTTAGTPQYYCEDNKPWKMTLIPVPVVNDTLLMTVYRLPLEPFDWTLRTADLDEPPIQLQETLVQGAMARAYQKRDADTYDPRHAAFHEAQFNQMVGPPVDYKTMEARRWNANMDVSIRPAAYVRSRKGVNSW